MRFKFLIGTIKAVGIFLIVSVIAITTFLYFSSINSTVSKGDGYELTIGMPQNEVFKRLPNALEAAGMKDLNAPINMNVYIRAGVPPKQLKLALNELDYSSLDNASKWILFIDSNYFFDSLTLEFCDKELCKIERYRQYFELP